MINNKRYSTYQSIKNDADEIELIKLSQKQLLRLPKELCIILPTLHNLIELQLNDNYFNKISKKVFECKKLKKLDLSTNLLRADGLVGISKLENLEELNLSNCGCVPEEICELSNLKKLILSCNYKNSYESTIETLLYFGGVGRSGFTSKICKIIGKNILELDFAKNFTVPTNINKLSKLEFLDITHCKLTNVPESIYKLKKLTHLDLSNNRIARVSENIGNLENLTFLNLNNNYLKKIPESIDKLQNLQTFEFFSPQLTKIPDTIWNIPNVKKLNFTNGNVGNKFSNLTIPKKITDHDIYITISSNMTIPEKIKRVSVICGQNSSKTLNNIPNDVEELTLTVDSPIELSNLPPTLQKLSILNNEKYRRRDTNSNENWVKKYVKNGKIKVPFGCVVYT
jgi:Leucine-rich repeat (LRR) protein